MGTLIIPEVELYKTINSCLNFIRLQANDNTIKEEETFLFQLLGNYADGNIDMYEEAKTIFQRKHNHNRFLTVRQSYNLEKLNTPCIVVFSGKEELHNSQSLGYSEGDYDNIPYSDELGALEILSRRYDCCDYMASVFSDSELEVTLIEYILRALLTSNLMSFQNKHLQGLKINSSALEIMNEEFDMKVKSCEISFFYEMKVPKLKGFKYINNIDTKGNLYIN
jgi:hypothetical protein